MNSTTLDILRSTLNKNKDKCISVIGTTCTGKTTFMKNIPEA